MKTKLGRMISWVILNVGLLVGLIVGEIYSLEGVLNVVIFSLWLFSILSFTYFSETITEKMLKDNDYFLEDPYAVHPYIYYGFDAVMLITLVYTGYFILGVVYFIHIIAITSFMRVVMSKREESNRFA